MSSPSLSGRSSLIQAFLSLPVSLVLESATYSRGKQRPGSFPWGAVVWAEMRDHKDDSWKAGGGQRGWNSQGGLWKTGWVLNQALKNWKEDFDGGEREERSVSQVKV